MENEEKKGECCENKDGGKCEHGMTNCCHNWKKCHMLKRIAVVILVILAFCLGSQWGEIKSEFRGNRYYNNRGMMNSNLDRFEGNAQRGVGEVTVKVNPVTPVAPVVPTVPAQ
jgi:hypothetical protein